MLVIIISTFTIMSLGDDFYSGIHFWLGLN